jgi:HTH-type transcriptional regulator/antitoxin HigA
MWESSAVRYEPTAMSVISLANALKVHPAIVAGKIRHEQRNYRLLSQFVGTGAVRHHFGGGWRHASSRRNRRRLSEAPWLEA